MINGRALQRNKRRQGYLNQPNQNE